MNNKITELIDALFNAVRYGTKIQVELDSCYCVWVQYIKDENGDFVDVYYDANNDLVMRIGYTGSLAQTADAIYAALCIVSK